MKGTGRPGGYRCDMTRVTVWSDYLCPWCYLNQSRVERLQNHHGIEVRWMPFELHPGIGPEGRPISAKRFAKFVELADIEGVDFALPDRIMPTRRAHLLACFVQATAAESFGDVHRQLFRAVWVEGRDVSDLEVLRTIAQGCGVDGDEAVRSVVDETHVDLLVAARDEGLENSVVAVPATLFPNGFLLPGFQDVAVIDRIAERMVERGL